MCFSYNMLHIVLYMQFIPNGLCTNVKESFPWLYQDRLNQLVQTHIYRL